MAQQHSQRGGYRQVSETRMGSRGTRGQAGSTGGQTNEMQTGQPQQMEDEPSAVGKQTAQQPTAPIGGKEKFEDHLTSEVELVLDDFQKLETTAEWCSDWCAERGPQLGECARICRDVADIAHLGIQLMSRNPYRHIDIGEMMQRVFEQSLAELRQHPDPPVQDTAHVLERALTSLSRGISAVQREGLGR